MDYRWIVLNYINDRIYRFLDKESALKYYVLNDTYCSYPVFK